MTGISIYALPLIICRALVWLWGDALATYGSWKAVPESMGAGELVLAILVAVGGEVGPAHHLGNTVEPALMLKAQVRHHLGWESWSSPLQAGALGRVDPEPPSTGKLALEAWVQMSLPKGHESRRADPDFCQWQHWVA